MSKHAIPWADDVDQAHYLQAYDYLALIWDRGRAEVAVAQLRAVPVTEQPASDILQACGLDPLPLHDLGVVKELRAVMKGKERTPVLAARDTDRLVLADGHHRLSLAYAVGPHAPVRWKVA